MVIKNNQCKPDKKIFYESFIQNKCLIPLAADWGLLSPPDLQKVFELRYPGWPL